MFNVRCIGFIFQMQMNKEYTLMFSIYIYTDTWNMIIVNG